MGNFPKDENQLAENCKKFDIPKRKAYLNFDEDQFLKNMLLMDLSLVEKEITPELVQELDDIILKQSEYRNSETINDVLQELEIRTFLPINILDRVDVNRRYIKDLNTDFRGIVEINSQSTSATTYKPTQKKLF